ncbi:MAG: hypothetical protein ACRD16_00120 [Thermoanaerobaculia bacterium]
MTDPKLRSIVTRMELAASPESTWIGLIFFEQIAQPPPLLLRLLLPRPIGSKGEKSRVGDEAVCLYRTGHLRKRVTHVEPGRSYGFEVVEQSLAVGGGIRLSGGRYSLREIPGGSTEIKLETRYVGFRRPRWVWNAIEETVCHRFHRHILRAIRQNLGASGNETFSP